MLVGRRVVCRHGRSFTKRVLDFLVLPLAGRDCRRLSRGVVAVCDMMTMCLADCLAACRGGRPMGYDTCRPPLLSAVRRFQVWVSMRAMSVRAGSMPQCLEMVWASWSHFGTVLDGRML